MKTSIALFAIALLSSPILCFAQEVDPTTACISNLVENPDFQMISTKVALAGASNQTIEMLTNKSKPKKNEKAVISKWNSSLTECINLGKEYRKENDSEFMQSAQAETFQNFEKLVEKLYMRKITYGAFANARAAELEKYNAKVAQNQRNIENKKNLETTVKIKSM
jgi:hypothetical protein